MNTARKNIYPLLLFLLALIVQLAALFYIFHPSEFFFKYWELALRFRGVIAPPIEVFYSSPFYILFLAAGQWVGCTVFDLQVLQTFLGACNCWLIYRAGTIYFGRTVGWIAGLGAVFYSPFVIYDSSFLPAVWVIAFNLAALICLGRAGRGGKPAWLAAAGLCIGLSIITRPNITIFLVFLLLYFLFRPARTELIAADFSLRREGLSRLLKSIALILIPALLVVLPVSIRNYTGSREFIPVTASGGWVFYCGNNERTQGFDFSPPPGLPDRIVTYYARPGGEKLSYLEHLLSRQMASTAEGRQLSHREATGYWFKEGMSFIRQHPRKYLILLGKKLLAAVNGYEPHDVPEVLDRASTLNTYPFIGIAVLLPLAVLGLLVCRPRAGGIFLYLYLAAYLISFLLIYVIPRFRLPLVPVLLLFAAAAVRHLYRRLREKRWLALAGNILILIVVAIPVNIKTPEMRRDRDSIRPAFLHGWRGLTAMKRGEWERAESEFNQALELNPQSYQARKGLQSLRKK